MQLNLLNALYLVLFSQTIFFGLFMLLEKKHIGIGVFFSALATHMILNLGFENGMLAAWPNITLAWGLLYPMSFYLYFKELTHSEFRWQSKYWLHFLPWLLIELLVVFGLNIEPLLPVIMPAFILGYFALTVKVVWQFRVHAFQQADLQTKSVANWATLLLVIYVLVIGFDVIRSLIENLLPWMNEQWMSQLQVFTLLVFVNLMIAKWLKSPEIFVGMSALGQAMPVSVDDAEPQVEVEIISQQDNDAENAQMAEKLKLLAQQVEDLMATALWYRQANLTLKDVAEKLASNEKYISSAINSEFGQNFSEYVNRHRVNEAMRLLIETEQPITEIFYQVGFNSKASFNLMFKKFTETTPSHFRKQNKSKKIENQ